MISADPDWLVSEYIAAPPLATKSRGKAAIPRVARFPVGFPLNLYVSLLPWCELHGIVLRSGSSVGLYRKSIFSWREIAKKDRALRHIADRRTIRVDYGGSCIDITGCRIRLAKKTTPCHTRSSWRKLRLTRGPCRLRRGAARKGKDAEGERDRCETLLRATPSSAHESRGPSCWWRLTSAYIRL